LIFLFKWVQDDEPTGSVVQDARLDKIFFAKQVSLHDVLLLCNSWTIALEKCMVAQLVTKFVSFIAPGGSLPCLQKPAAMLY
jgi:hypothetical protein